MHGGTPQASTRPPSAPSAPCSGTTTAAIRPTSPPACWGITARRALRSVPRMLRDAKPGLRETGALGLGELEDSRALGPLSDALGDAEVTVRARAAGGAGRDRRDGGDRPPARALKTALPRYVASRRGLWARSKDVRACRPLGDALNDAVARRASDGCVGVGEIEDEAAVRSLRPPPRTTSQSPTSGGVGARGDRERARRSLRWGRCS